STTQVPPLGHQLEVGVGLARSCYANRLTGAEQDAVLPARRIRGAVHGDEIRLPPARVSRRPSHGGTLQRERPTHRCRRFGIVRLSRQAQRSWVIIAWVGARSSGSGGCVVSRAFYLSGAVTMEYGTTRRGFLGAGPVAAVGLVAAGGAEA